MLNSPIIRARALALAARIEREKPNSIKQQVQLAFQLTYQRFPNEDELKMCFEHLKIFSDQHKSNPQKEIEKPKYVIRRMVEEMTGLAFWWVEDFDVYAGGEYKPDLKPWDVGIETLAMGDLCLVLFNSNEFVYVY